MRDCPVCGGDCLEPAGVVITGAPTRFLPCPECHINPRKKGVPLSDRFYEVPCRCGRRYIDEVFAHMYVILIEEGIFSGNEPLLSVGQPLVHPGFAMQRPPFLPEKSLVLLSRVVTPEVAERLVHEVPELKGVVRSGAFIPGITDPCLRAEPQEYTLLAGCDVRADIFPTSAGPVVIYKEQSKIHVEFPRGENPKIHEVESRIRLGSPYRFIDASCGAGTLGITAARNAVPRVLMNDAWYPAAYWASVNLEVNREFLFIDSVTISGEPPGLHASRTEDAPRLVGEARGEQEVLVYCGDLFRLYEAVADPHGLAVLDLYEKADPSRNQRCIAKWREHFRGEVFIP